MNTPIDDNLLHAWLDNELASEQREQVERWLQDHPEDAARVRLWSADAQAMRATLEPILSDPVPQRLTQIVWNRAPATLAAPWQRWAAAVAVFVLGGAVGAAATWRVQTAQNAAQSARQADRLVGAQGWVRRAAVAHSVYVPEVRHPVEVKAQEEHLARWLTRRIEVPVKLFDLREQGFELVGGRLLPDASGPSAQLMYQAIEPPVGNAKPERVTVYLRKPDSATPAAFAYERQGELGLFYWVEGDSAHGNATGYALAGTLSRERLLVLAEAIYRQGAQKP
ncbi:MAG: anti-sigma factor [Burkholderiaceae bacterium]